MYETKFLDFEKFVLTDQPYFQGGYGERYLNYLCSQSENEYELVLENTERYWYHCECFSDIKESRLHIE